MSGEVSGAAAGPAVVDASDSVKGIVELATTAEAEAHTDTARAVTPAGLADLYGTLADAVGSISGLDDNLGLLAGTLAGGTTGQILKKTSNADGDYDWTATAAVPAVTLTDTDGSTTRKLFLGTASPSSPAVGDYWIH